MRLADMNMPQFNNRKHFYAVAAKLMRQVLVDHARQRLADKRGGGATPVELNEGILYSSDRAQDYLLLHQALERLAEADPRKAQTVELRFFSGMTTEEIAEHLGISVSTVLREQRFAEAWLSRYMRSGVRES
jgi:RNA polymerase sigma factor (TIGR02999 family)